METAVLIRWGRPALTTYEQDQKAFMDAVKLYEALKREGQITSYEIYGYETGDRDREAGFTILKGEEERLKALPHDPRVEELTIKTALLNSHVTIDYLHFGEAVLKRVEATGKVVRDLHLVPVG